MTRNANVGARERCRRLRAGTPVRAGNGGANHAPEPGAERAFCVPVLDRADLQTLRGPKPSYTADWESLPDWQRETDADIFEAVEAATLHSIEVSRS